MLIVGQDPYDYIEVNVQIDFGLSVAAERYMTEHKEQWIQGALRTETIEVEC